MADDPQVSTAVAAPPARREWRVPAVPDNVPRARRAVRDFAADHGADHEVVANLALAVTEAVTNAVLHAYVDREPGEVLVVAQAAAGEVLVAVLDDGRGMQPRPDSPGLGMGLPMIGQLTTSVDIRERPAGGTEVRMRFAAPTIHGPVVTPIEPDARLQLLVEVDGLAKTGGWPHKGVVRLVHLLVPAVADACTLDRVHGDALERLAEVGASAPHLDAVPADAGVQVVDVEPVAGDDQPAFWVVVPLRDEDRPLGMLRLGMTAGRGRPEAQDLVFLETLGERAARGLASTQLVTDLRRTRRRVERILDALAEAVTVNDGSGRTVWANAAAARLMGAGSVEELLVARPGDLAARFHITDEAGTPVGVEDFPGTRVVRGEDAPALLTRSVLRATGQERWLLTKATLLDDDGERLAVNIIEDVTDATRTDRQQRFLAHTGEVLGRSLDPAETLRDVAALLVPQLADWCGVHLVGPGGRIERVAVAGREPLADALERLYLGSRGTGVADTVLADGEPLLVPEVTDELLRRGSVDEAHLAALRGAQLRSVAMLPLRAGGRTIGVLTLVTAESARAFRAADLAFGEDVARRVATAVDNARRFTERGGAGT